MLLRWRRREGAAGAPERALRCGIYWLLLLLLLWRCDDCGNSCCFGAALVLPDMSRLLQRPAPFELVGRCKRFRA